MVVVVVVVLPVAEVVAGRDAVFPIVLLVFGAEEVLAVAEVLGLAVVGFGAGAVVLGLVAALAGAVAGLLLTPVAVLTVVPVFVTLVVVVVLPVPTAVTPGWALEVAVEEPAGFLLGAGPPAAVLGFFSAVEVVAGFLAAVLAAVFVTPLATRLWVVLGLVPGPVVAGPLAVVFPLMGALDLPLGSSAFPGASLTVEGASCLFRASSGCGGVGAVPFWDAPSLSSGPAIGPNPSASTGSDGSVATPSGFIANTRR